MNKRIYIVMGVSGCGKTTLGKALSRVIGLPFYDADDFHAAEHIEKMKAGNPLTDDDRAQWLDKVGAQIGVVQPGAILACSALKQAYRQRLEDAAGTPLIWVYLKGSSALIASRLAARKNHFFDASLLASQFEILEEPLNAVHLDCRLDTEAQLHALLRILG